MTDRLTVTDEARRLVRLAARNREFPTAAKVIAHAINDCYEQEAQYLLEASEEKYRILGISKEERDGAVVVTLLLKAATARLRHASKKEE